MTARELQRWVEAAAWAVYVRLDREATEAADDRVSAAFRGAARRAYRRYDRLACRGAAFRAEREENS